MVEDEEHRVAVSTPVVKCLLIRSTKQWQIEILFEINLVSYEKSEKAFFRVFQTYL